VPARRGCARNRLQLLGKEVSSVVRVAAGDQHHPIREELFLVSLDNRSRQRSSHEKQSKQNLGQI
jgi:hypothetical protein